MYRYCSILLLFLVFVLQPSWGQRTKRTSTFTIEGEVNVPGTYQIEADSMTVFDAMALAGDMTVYGMPNKVMVRRLSGNGTYMVERLNLDEKKYLHSPYFYIRPEDTIWVCPNKAKTNVTSFARKSTIWVSITSTLFSVANMLIQKLK